MGEKFEQQTLSLGSDNEGEVVATLIRSLPPARRLRDKLFGLPRPFENVDVLYVHGWSDYFFQKELADFWTSRGARFFAIDLRKYGRSLGEDQTPGYIEELDSYDQEIEAALQAMQRDPNRKLILLGHSTGGLVLTLWADRNPDLFDAIVLNSPWLEFQLSAIGRKAFSPIVDLTARFNAGEPVPQMDFGYYTRAQQEVATKDRPIQVNTKWRPLQSMPVRMGWIKAILAGHEKVAAGLHINKPIYVMLSKNSALPTKWDESLKHSDTVLNVEAVAKAALHLGQTVTIERVDGALHDIFLSAPDVRDHAYKQLERWMKGFLAS